MPTVLDVFGLRFFFYSEEHPPVHVHVVDADGRMKIELLPEIRIVENNGIKPRNVKRAMQLAEMYQEEIISKWREYHGSENKEG